MSGSESIGYAASRAGMFEGRPWVVVPGPASEPADVAHVRELAEACGARPVELDAAAHDRAVAAISHLPLVASLALATAALDGPDWPVARKLAAQGWRDMTRLAHGDPAMGGGMLATNARAVAARLRVLRAELDAWQERFDALAAAPQDGSAPSDGPAGLADLVERLQVLADRLAVGREGEGPA
jgi:prephenate dehydrogenase